MALAGGVGAATLTLVRAASVAAAAERSGREGATPETATFAVDVGNLLIGKMAPVSVALVTGAATVAGRRDGLLPPWLVRATGALTVGLVSPVNFLFVAPCFAWVAVVGWLLGRPRKIPRHSRSDLRTRARLARRECRL